MKVAVLTNFIPPYRVPLFKALRDRVTALRIFISTPMEGDRAWETGWDDLPVTVQRTHTIRRHRRHPGGHRETSETHLPYDTYNQLRQFAPDVIISGEMGPRTILASLYRRLNPACRLIIWATVSERTELARNGRYTRALRRLLIGRADGVLVNGASGRRYVETLGMARNRIAEMPYSMSLDQYSATPRRDPRSAHRLLIVGQLIERKGIVPWLQAANGWAETENDRQIEIWVAGHGPLEPQIANLPMVSNIGLNLLGPVQYEALPGLYAQCGILVFPTQADEWGIVVNEAMAAGLPVMGSIHAQAVEELVKDGINGWQFDPTSRQSAHDALQRAFAASAAQLDTMRGAARATVAAITPDAMAEKMKSACDMVIAGRDTLPVVHLPASSALDPALDKSRKTSVNVPW